VEEWEIGKKLDALWETKSECFTNTMLNPKSISAGTLEVSGGHWRPNKPRALFSRRSALCTALCKTLHHLYWLLSSKKLWWDFSTYIDMLITTQNSQNFFRLLSVFQVTLAKNVSHYISLAILDPCLYDLGIELIPRWVTSYIIQFLITLSYVF
jgi:hypothetical protein